VTSGSSADRPGGGGPTLTLPGRFRAAVFDLDGLLIDTEPGWQRAEAELLRRRGMAYSEADAVASLGSPVGQVVDGYAARLGLDAAGRDRLLDELLGLVRALYASELVIRPGAAELLHALHGRLPLAVASNTPRALVEEALASSGLGDSFDVVVTAEEVAHPKPAPDIYLAACGRLGVEPSQTVALEDSTLGIASAAAAGLTVVAVPQWPSVDTSGADLLLGSLTQVSVSQ
jgi:HAD superfamily hydrolase (TIGR01509 family)